MKLAALYKENMCMCMMRSKGICIMRFHMHRL